MQPGPIGGYIKSTLHGDVHGAKDLALGLTIGWWGPCLLLRSIFTSIEEFSYFSPLHSRILSDKNLSYSHQLGIVQRYFGQKEKFSNFTIPQWDGLVQKWTFGKFVRIENIPLWFHRKNMRATFLALFPVSKQFMEEERSIWHFFNPIWLIFEPNFFLHCLVHFFGWHLKSPTCSALFPIALKKSDL